MDIEHADTSRPDIVITLTAEEGDQLYTALQEAISYASDCGESSTFTKSLSQLLGRYL